MHSLQQQSGLARQSTQGVQRLPSSRCSSTAIVKQLHHHICQQHMLALPATQPCIAPRLQQQQQHGRRRAAAVTRAGPPEQHACNGSKKKLAVFVSGGGSNFKAIHAACLKGQINAEVVAVVSDVPSCGGVAYAAQHGIPTLTYPASKKGLFPGLTPQELVQQLKHELGADYVLLAGYLKLIPVELVSAYKRAMLNIHPGLLPSFGGKGLYGERVHAAVIKSGARFSGPTVHFVDEEYDTGPILAQRCVSVSPTDSPKQLAARVLEQEHQVYPYAVSALVDGRITWREDGIPIIWEAS